MRRILPHLRLYSSWLLSTTELLMARTELQLQMRKFWHVYAETLSMLVAIFPIIDIVEVPYLLMEDADTIGFSPFIDLVRKQHMFNSKDMLKPVYDEETFGPRSVDDEMLSRVKSLVKDGILLCRHQVCHGLELLLRKELKKFLTSLGTIWEHISAVAICRKSLCGS